MVIKSMVVKYMRQKADVKEDVKRIKIFSQITSRKSHLADLVIDGGIIIKLVLQK
jgi:hypothetical protein